EDPVAVGGRDQLERPPETVLGVLERAVGDAERERRSSIVSGIDRCASLVEDCTRFVDATGGHEVVEEAGGLAGAGGFREVGGGQGGAGGGGGGRRGER